ncbi:hypothetical protein [Segetibacter koreensis]|nr:hypothetical protein [Segetibacter koreensis]
MKTITAQFVYLIFIAGRIKRKIELTIIHLTNMKPFATLQSIIISMAN